MPNLIERIKTDLNRLYKDFFHLKDALLPLQTRIEQKSRDADKQYIQIAFFFHFIFYIWALFKPQNDIPLIPFYIFSISLLTFFMYFFFRKIQDHRVLILSYNFALLFVLSWIHFLEFSYSDQFPDFLLMNYSFLALFIILQSVRLRVSACLSTSLILIGLYAFTVTFLALEKNILFDAGILFMPPVLFLLAGIVGTLLIYSSKKMVIEANLLIYEKMQMSHELVLARKVQDSLFPSDHKIKNINFVFYRVNHSEVGGDFFDFVQLREGNIGVFLTDVSGHGVSSSMIASILKVLVSTIPYRLKLNPASLLDYLDSKIHKDFGTHHASAVYIFLDFINKQMAIGNAGHPYPMIALPGEEFKEVMTVGSILGYRIKIPIVKSETFPLINGTRIFLFTDGLIETPNRQGDPLDTTGLLDILNRHREERDIVLFKEKIIADLNRYFQGSKYTDDTMFLALDIAIEA